MPSQIIRLHNVQLAFPAIAQPQAYADGEPAYGAKFPIEPGSENHKKIEDAMLAVAKEQWNDKGEATLKRLVEDGKVALTKKVYRSKKTNEAYDGFEGMHYISARATKTAPTVYDQYNTKIEDKRTIERMAYSGAIVHASIEIWSQDNKWGQRINCSLRGLMLTGKGSDLSGGSAPASEDEFADLADKAEDFV